MSASRPFKVNVGYSTAPVLRRASSPGTDGADDEDGDGDEGSGDEAQTKGAVVGNRAAMLHEMARLSGDLVKRVEIQF